MVGEGRVHSQVGNIQEVEIGDSVDLNEDPKIGGVDSFKGDFKVLLTHVVISWDYT